MAFQINFHRIIFIAVLLMMYSMIAVSIDPAAGGFDGNGNINKNNRVPQSNFNKNFPAHAAVEKTGANPNNIKYNVAGPGNPEHNGMAMDTSRVKKRKQQQMRLSETLECADDVNRYCSKQAALSNFVILNCLQDNDKAHELVSDACQNFMWGFKRNLTLNDAFDKESNKDCGAELAQLKECRGMEVGKGLRIPCLMEHYDEVKSKSCRNFLNKMGSIIFSDYRFLYSFMNDCNDDITTLHCGRMEYVGTNDDAPHSQGKTVECLNKKHKEIKHKSCKKALHRVNEMTSRDFHNDRPLYYACKTDREHFCPNVRAGDGAVYNCLFKNIGSEKMSEECREQLELKQQEVSVDIKVDRMFYESCKADIKANKCGQSDSDPDAVLEEDLSRTTVLLCLESVKSDGKKIRPECAKQVFELRAILMKDYKISPEIVSACREEISEFCDGLGPNGQTLDCLMKEVTDEKHKDFGSECKAQIALVLEIADVGEDIRMDIPLKTACGDVITSACAHRTPGQGEIITCLLENLDHEGMTDDCEDHLLRIQYFAVRDFKLDHHLFTACKRDAKKICHAIDYDHPRKMAPESGPLIFSCLHRNLRSNNPAEQKISKQCSHEVRRVLKERSMRIKLHPEVEDACMLELSDLCSDDDEHKVKGAEMECLQTNLEDLSDKCKEVVVDFTEEQSENLELDRILMKACTPMISKFCNDKLENDAMPSDVLDCLIEYKNSYGMDAKCAAGIEHHQLISLKDLRFNHKFRTNCNEAISVLCRNKNTKYEVVACLSEHVRNDTLMEKEHRVSRKCRKELRFELLQRGESINLDPELKKKCSVDVSKFCANIQPGKGEVLECLRSHKKKLSESCHKLVFKREQDENMNGDYVLLHTCKGMIKRYCRLDGDEEELLDCLKAHKNDNDFDESCRKIVMRRQVEQTHDYRLNPHLQKACRMDIPKFCAHVFEHRKPGSGEMEGKIINCLKKQYSNKEKSLSKDCEYEIKSRIKEAAIDINQNPVVAKLCKKDIRTFCLDKVSNVRQMEIEDNEEGIQTFGQGTIIECLKKNFQKLKDMSCKKEVAFLVAESRVDIHVDPLLHSACQQDLISLCQHIEQGQGRQMSCLLSYLDTDPDSLSQGCRGMMSRRKDLWEYAAQVAPPENFFEFAEQINASPARNYFLAVMFTAIGIILIVGITCGRVTKRVRAEVKNK